MTRQINEHFSFQDIAWLDQIETNQNQWKIEWEEKIKKNGCPAYHINNYQEKCWVKPRRDDRLEVAAKEKIAADLATLLKLPVSSILLSKVTKPNGELCPAAMSKYSTDLYHEKWSRFMKKRSQSDIDAVNTYFQDNSDIVAAMFVFDTWIRNRDRTERNIMIGFNGDGVSSVYFYDFDVCMSWRENKKEIVTIAKFPESLKKLITEDQCLRFIKILEHLPETIITTVVERIPPFYIAKHRQTVYIEALLNRRSMLRKVFQAYFKEREGVQTE